VAIPEEITAIVSVLYSAFEISGSLISARYQPRVNPVQLARDFDALNEYIEYLEGFLGEERADKIAALERYIEELESYLDANGNINPDKASELDKQIDELNEYINYLENFRSEKSVEELQRDKIALMEYMAELEVYLNDPRYDAEKIAQLLKEGGSYLDWVNKQLSFLSDPEALQKELDTYKKYLKDLLELREMFKNPAEIIAKIKDLRETLDSVKNAEKLQETVDKLNEKLGRNTISYGAFSKKDE